MLYLYIISAVSSYEVIKKHIKVSA